MTESESIQSRRSNNNSVGDGANIKIPRTNRETVKIQDGANLKVPLKPDNAGKTKSPK